MAGLTGLCVRQSGLETGSTLLPIDPLDGDLCSILRDQKLDGAVPHRVGVWGGGDRTCDIALAVRTSGT
jgi:hypothetical protein